MTREPVWMTPEVEALLREIQDAYSLLWWACPDCYSIEAHHRPGCERAQQ